MQLERCKDQSHATLDEFYSEITAPPEMGKTMLSLIGRLRALEDGRKVWGLTSHYRLCLLAENSSRSPWFVTCVAADASSYRIEYLMPDRIAPWPHAYVCGEAQNEDEAVKMILTAMENSKGWVGHS